MTTKPHIAVVGCGAWGRAFGCAIATHGRMVFWDRDFAAAQTAAAQTADVVAKSDFAVAVDGAHIVVLAVNSGAFASVLAKIHATNPAAIVVWLTKGFDPATQQPLCKTAEAILGSGARYGAISGPSFASEVQQKKPTALALAVSQTAEADFAMLQQQFHQPYLRIYPEPDLIGLCVGGAVKNIIAIAAGIADGLALGANARAALITRGLAEMAAVNHALGGQPASLHGLVGMGDLVLTCCSDLSRNRRFGLAVAKQKDALLNDARRRDLLANKTNEGVTALAPVLACADAHQLPVPIIRAVAQVVGGQLAPAAAVAELLARQPPASPY